MGNVRSEWQANGACAARPVKGSSGITTRLPQFDTPLATLAPRAIGCLPTSASFAADGMSDTEPIDDGAYADA